VVLSEESRKTLINPAGQTTTWTRSSSAITLKDGAVIVNDGTFNVQALGDLDSNGNTGAAVAFTNNSVFLYDSSNQSFTIQNVAFNTATPGTVAVQNGELQFSGGGTETSAAFTIASGATLDFTGSGTATTYTLDSGTTISGAGTLAVNGGQSTISGTAPRSQARRT